ncbi:MAG: RNA 2'-phosphotransferase [Piscinibacter sp.]|uniref:RNA 2'-phosphotransferase n=1 Tax=Piscinibacter sp. TaxID=1903157 RepID=UPI00258BBD83|nr:RNA 2'-phosphotransferase [Piscinibacter sp.]MCW5665469.1 RNA 2'-phosphotransferase [Piscinibacter sp.]
MEDLGPQATAADLTALSRLLSRVLRHEPELVGVRLDASGWARVDDVLQGIRKAGRSPAASKRVRTLPAVTLEMLAAVVATNSKQRFALSDDGQWIRAVQGHSVEVNLGHPSLEPPPVLFHGTAAASWRAIAAEGLKAGTRHAVHLSVDVITAKRVGARHGRPVVLEVAAAQMHSDGFEFSLSDNGVWLVSVVPPKYLKLRS